MFPGGLYLRANSCALASFEEDALVDMFEQVCDVVEPGAETPASGRRTRFSDFANNVCSPALMEQVSFAQVSTHSLDSLRQ